MNNPNQQQEAEEFVAGMAAQIQRWAGNAQAVLQRQQQWQQQQFQQQLQQQVLQQQAAAALRLPPLPPPPQAALDLEDEEDDDDEDEDDDDEEEAVDQLQAPDGSLDGGVVVGTCAHNDGKRKSVECDIVLYFEVDEVIPSSPNHQVCKPGVVVSIGLDKSTKLQSVFEHYVKFCNEHGKGQPELALSDIEFVHSQVLKGDDTSEVSALMKNDRVHVRRTRALEREIDYERRKQQREADKEYFKQMRHLLPDYGGVKTADLVLDCCGKLVDSMGQNQQVLSTTVRGHAAILSKRCPWLGDLIDKARREQRSGPLEGGDEDSKGEEDDGPEITLEAEAESNQLFPGHAVGQAAARIESEPHQDSMVSDYDISVLSFPRRTNHRENNGVAQIEIDDDEDDDDQDPPFSNIEVESLRSGSPLPYGSPPKVSGDMLWVTLPNHSPEAVRLLLEYCYTNRVIPLGQEAFVQACRTKPHKHQGPVAPFPHSVSTNKRWPNNGKPVISFSAALDAITLAEEASMPRFSLMCELAAANLVTADTVSEALAACSAQQQATNNNLPRLRKAALDIILSNYGSRANGFSFTNGKFFDELQTKADMIVPPLLTGTMEAVLANEKSAKHQSLKREQEAIGESIFDECDREDYRNRTIERRRRREERYASGTVPFFAGSELHFEPEDSWEEMVVQGSLKRLRGHGSRIVPMPTGSSYLGAGGIGAVARGYVKRASRSRRRHGN